MENKISLSIEFDQDTRSGKLLFHNNDNADLNFWNTGNQWGDYVLSFEGKTLTGSFKLEKKRQIYTRNVPSTFRIPAGKGYIIPFNLNDSSWTGGDAINGIITQLTAIYTVSETLAAIKRNIFCGSIVACWTANLSKKGTESESRGVA